MSKRVSIDLIRKAAKEVEKCYLPTCTKSIPKGSSLVCILVYRPVKGHIKCVARNRLHIECFSEWVRYAIQQIKEPGGKPGHGRPSLGLDRAHMLERRAALTKARRKLDSWSTAPEEQKAALLAEFLEITAASNLPLSKKVEKRIRQWAPWEDIYYDFKAKLKREGRLVEKAVVRTYRNDDKSETIG